MSPKNRKGLKPWVFKNVALFTGICYLMAPLQQELKELMHFLSHSLDQGIGHHSIASHTHDFNGHHQDKGQAGTSSSSLDVHEHMDSNEIGRHGHPHPHNSEPHRHEIIAFMSMAFSASTATPQDHDKIEVPSDLDKHLVVPNYMISQAILAIKKSYFSNIPANTSKGIQSLILPPPKQLS